MRTNWGNVTPKRSSLPGSEDIHSIIDLAIFVPRGPSTKNMPPTKNNKDEVEIRDLSLFRSVINDDDEREEEEEPKDPGPEDEE